MSVYVPADLKRQVRDHFANCCAYCRTAEDLTVAIFEMEHILPHSAGGETVFDNLCLACPTFERWVGKKPVESAKTATIIKSCIGREPLQTAIPFSEKGRLCPAISTYGTWKALELPGTKGNSVVTG